ncbi:MAG: alpha/beta hydrolase [Erysipelotrichaceae bacterium]|nr:alpha/beta hydrolase [Erysipelotrichaceae bacterium]
MKKHKVKIQCAGKMIPLIILKPSHPKEKGPGLLWIHGGGYVTGMAAMVYISRAKNLVDKYGVTVISPEYRLAKEAPYPYPLLDCYDALLYMKNHAEELGIRDDQIMVGGESAGGGLCAALCLYARDTKQVNIACQFPLYPMLDDRETESSKDNPDPVWNTQRNQNAWSQYLRNIQVDIPSYAVPARETDYSNLPPAYTFVSDSEPFYHETMTYINNLKDAGIEASMDIYPNESHAFDMLKPWKKVSRQAIQKFEEKFDYALQHYFKKQ